MEFLDCWLEVIKDREWTYNYLDTNEALVSLFLAAPFMDHFHPDDILAVHGHLTSLFSAFIGKEMSQPQANRELPLPMHPEDIHEINWTLVHNPTDSSFEPSDTCIWDVTWNYMSRARLKPVPVASVDWQGTTPLFESTRVKPGAIVCIPPKCWEASGEPIQHENVLRDWIFTRAQTFKVEAMENIFSPATGRKQVMVTLQPFVSYCPEVINPIGIPHAEIKYLYSGAEGNTKPVNDLRKERMSVPFDDVKLVELNRGKAGVHVVNGVMIPHHSWL
jgi:hypothetical protein